MKICEHCKRELTETNVTICPDCGAYYCSDCVNKNKHICTNCYESLD